MKTCKFITLLCCILSLLSSAQFALAETPTPRAPVDAEATNLNESVYRVLQQIADPKNMTLDEAKALRAAVLSDRKIDPSEKDLFFELTQGESVEVKVSTQAKIEEGSRTLTLSQTEGQAKQVLESLIIKMDLKALWDGNAEDFARIVDLYQGYPAARKAVGNAAMEKVMGAWKDSNLENAYEPLRDEISSVCDKLEKEPGPGRTTGCKILYDACLRVDKYDKDEIPDYLYQWLVPESEKATGV